MELILTDAIGDWESEGGAPTQPCGPLTNAMKSSSGKQSSRIEQTIRAGKSGIWEVWNRLVRSPAVKGLRPKRAAVIGLPNFA